MNVYKELGLKEVINANGKMTVLGASSVKPQIAEDMKNALSNFVVMEELMDYTGKVVAEKTKAEDGCPTQGAASGIVISVAASIAGENIHHIQNIPYSEGLKNEIIIQKGHSVDFGGSVSQMICIGGGKPVEVGCANKVEKEHIEEAVTDKTAALLYIKSHHAVQKGMQSIETMIEIARKKGLPLIIDAAAEEDLEKYIKLGAHMVIYSGGKALSGPTSGFICGKKEYIKACKKQYKGVGRAMKVSKEAMIGLISALNLYDINETDKEAQIIKMEKVCKAFEGCEGVTCRIVQDEAGREIYRAEIKIDESITKISAEKLNKRLKEGNPAVFIREYYVGQGILSIDPRPLFPGQEDIIAEQIKKYLSEAR